MGKSIIDFASVATAGLDLARHVFQVHGVDAAGRVVFDKAIRRDELLAFFAALPPVPCRAGGLRFGASLGARADRARPRRA